MRSISAVAQRSSVRSERTIASSIAVSPSSICPARPKVSAIRNVKYRGADAAPPCFGACATQQPQSGDEIPALEEEHCLMAEAKGAPACQRMLCRMVEQ